MKSTCFWLKLPDKTTQEPPFQALLLQSLTLKLGSNSLNSSQMLILPKELF